MKPLTFKQLPLVVEIAVGIALYNAWLSIEEFVINRHGPCGNTCRTTTRPIRVSHSAGYMARVQRPDTIR